MFTLYYVENSNMIIVFIPILSCYNIMTKATKKRKFLIWVYSSGVKDNIVRTKEKREEYLFCNT